MFADAVLRTFQHVWKTLDQLDVSKALIGGMALPLWNHIRATHDVDLLIQVENVTLDRLIQAIADAGIRPKHDPPIVQLEAIRLLQVLYEPPGTVLDIQIDLLLAEPEFHQTAMGRQIPAQLPDQEGEYAVVSCEDLVLLKLLGGRIIDKADAAALVRANRATLDYSYLASWLHKLELIQEFAAIWKEALPGETIPTEIA